MDDNSPIFWFWCPLVVFLIKCPSQGVPNSSSITPPLFLCCCRSRFDRSFCTNLWEEDAKHWALAAEDETFVGKANKNVTKI
ncbi:hypothetical protein niasHT_016967 [Heterodera trifolii]|uniref:Secreted protein n=1 Tax=Heterodera trifolii TaxID=157864 RepID=A0ABD2LCR0_9BILA